MTAGERRFVLRLYVTGRSPRSERAITAIQKICEQHQEPGFDLVVIDVLEQPRLAEDEKIIATPTLIKEEPLPVRRIIGDLSDTQKVIAGLDLAEAS